MDKETKALQFDIKAVNDDGTFEGIASTYGPPADAYGDVIEKGAFTKTINDHDGEIVVLWQHDASEPVGLGKLEDTDRGLLIKGTLEMGLETAKKAHIALKAKLVKGLSIGFKTIRKKTEDGLRHLKEIKLYEVSLVTFPANSLAQVTGVKSAFSDAMDSHAKSGAVWGTWQVFDRVVMDIMFDREKAAADKLEEIGEAVDEFKAAFLLALPDYLKAQRLNSDDSGKSLTDESIAAIQSEIASLQALLAKADGTEEAAVTEPQEAAEAEPEPDAFHSDDVEQFKGAILSALRAA